MKPEEINKRALALADQYINSLIDGNTVCEEVDGELYADLKSLVFSTRTFKKEFAFEVEYAEARGLFSHHPTRPNLIQIVEVD